MHLYGLISESSSGKESAMVHAYRSFAAACAFLLLIAAACGMDDHTDLAPQVTPVVSSVGRDSVVLQWNSAGGEWSYRVSVAEDSMPDNVFHGTNGRTFEDIQDTVFVVDGLTPSTWYKVVVWTWGDSTSSAGPNQSWPPLQFRTLE